MMCGSRNLLRATILGLLGVLQAPASSAQTTDLRVFASCAGRLSAVMEDQWLLSDPAADVTARQREAMLSLVSAMTEPGQEKVAMAWRVEAKAAQAELLSLARFGLNDATAARAARRSDELLTMCRSLLLG
jgi:hypothetical protein